jgi:HEPN domain-containing protein
VEKYLKALLVMLQVEFSRTHDIEMLILLLPTELKPSLAVEQQRRLTEYATVMRYSGPYEPAALSEAAEAVDLARQVCREIRNCLADTSLF